MVIYYVRVASENQTDQSRVAVLLLLLGNIINSEYHTY